MKVAFFIGSLSRGGTETLVLDTLRRRDIAPFECILVYRNEGDLSDYYRATGVPMIRIKPTGLVLGYILKLRQLLKREDVDVLHSQTLWNGFLGVFCTCFSRVRLVSSYHGLLSSVKNWLCAHLVIWVADASVFVSNYEREWYLKRILFAPKRRCHVVYNGVDFSKFDKEYSAPEFLANNNSGMSGIMKMAMVGNFVSGRSQFFVCQALKALKDRGDCNFIFYFIGKRSLNEPERYDDCSKYCKENGLWESSISFLGGRSDIPSILPYLDAFVYSSECDSFGIAVVEAMAAGIPVIVNDWDVMKEITDNGDLATLYKTQDINDCVAKIEDLANHLNERKSVAIRTSRIVRERYCIENHIRNLGKVYDAFS